MLLLKSTVSIFWLAADSKVMFIKPSIPFKSAILPAFVVRFKSSRLTLSASSRRINLLMIPSVSIPCLINSASKFGSGISI